MQTLILLLVLILAGAAKSATPLCCPFPLPNGLEVGDRWTYWLNYPHGPDSLITVVASHELGGQTYFEMSNDGGLYRVDDEKRTWKYDTASESEIPFWDIWPDFIPYPEELQDTRDNKEREAWAREHEYGFYLISNLNGWKDGVHAGPVVVAGIDITDIFRVTIHRHGPYRPEDVGSVPHFPGAFFQLHDSDTWKELLIDWGVTELYTICLDDHRTVFSPQVGTIFFGAGPGPQGFRHVLKTYGKGGATAVEETSLGRIKKTFAIPFSIRK